MLLEFVGKRYWADKMKPSFYLLPGASWVFFAVMGYLSTTTLEHGLAAFWAGSAIFLCVSLFFFGMSLWKRQGQFALAGILVIVPFLVLVFFLEMMGPLGRIGVRAVPLSF